MKSQKRVDLSQQYLKDAINKNVAEPSYSNMIKIPLAAQPSIISEGITKKLLALKDNAGSSIVIK
ncbi:MAG TPA: hypothetical protein VIJ75_05035 [Hanamia sp.]